MAFPDHRPRRLRENPVLRRMVRETRLSRDQLIYPVFVRHGRDVREEIPSMPGQYRLSLDRLGDELAQIRDLGLPAVLLFGIPEASSKDAQGTPAWDGEGLVCRALRQARHDFPELLLIADLCLCEYTDHGHCGVITDSPARGRHVDNDATLQLLSRAAQAYASAGADIIAPSDMMDGRVAAVRRALDESGRQDVVILSYAAKYASAYYGPFRDAAESAPQFGDRGGYQMDPPNAREAVREALLDVEEGADIVMVKPALPYLDVLRRIKESCRIPVAAYQVSGEYSALCAAFERGWLDRERTVMETLTGIRRAGADLIVTYFAKDAARRLS